MLYSPPDSCFMDKKGKTQEKEKPQETADILNDWFCTNDSNNSNPFSNHDSWIMIHKNSSVGKPQNEQALSFCSAERAHAQNRRSWHSGGNSGFFFYDNVNVKSDFRESGLFCFPDY